MFEPTVSLSRGLRGRALTVAALVTCAAAQSAQAGEPVAVLDATLVSSSGEPAQLRSYWGKPTLLFYETPDAVKINQPAKDELKRLSDALGLRQAVTTVAVVNLEGLDWWPARPIAFGSIRAEEKKAAVPVLVDLGGALRRGPWLLDPKAATLLVLSPAGEVVFHAEGRVDGQRFVELKATLERLLTAVAAR